MVNSQFNISYVSQNEYAKALKQFGRSERTASYEGQVVFAATFGGDAAAFDTSELHGHITTLAREFGDVLGVAPASVVKGTWEFRTEFYKISDAEEAIAQITETCPSQFKVRRRSALVHKYLTNLPLQGWTIIAREYQDSISDSPPSSGRSVRFAPKSILRTPRKVVVDDREYQESPTGRTRWTQDEDGNTVTVAGSKIVPRAYQTPIDAPPMATPAQRRSDDVIRTPINHFDVRLQTRSGSFPGGPIGISRMADGDLELQLTPTNGQGKLPPQQVDIDSIREGHDVRTTIMLRNIPNDMTQAQFKRFLDLTSKGKYDFSYLRMDFSKGQNVGYGFVNFSDPLHIIEFMEHYEGTPYMPNKKFSIRRGPKLAEMAYAVVQGVEGSIEKFRNSSVMDEAPEYRPKLWYTHDNAPEKSMVGKEKPFPPPNNEAKHQRSRDNATHIGLFAPGRDGGRGGHRNRGQRSQWDRGTRAQIQEDAFYNHMATPTRYAAPNYPMVGGPVHMMPGYFPAFNAAGYNGNGHAANAFGYPPAFSNPFNPAATPWRPRQFGFRGNGSVGAPEHTLANGGPVQLPQYGYQNIGGGNGHYNNGY
jgi:hypothetical protein